MAAICGVCNLLCNDGGNDLRCSVCDKVFHQKCIKPTESDARRLRSLKDWKCMNCQPSSASGSLKSSDSTALTKYFLFKDLEDFKIDIFGELRAFRKEVEEVTTSLQFLYDAVDT